MDAFSTIGAFLVIGGICAVLAGLFLFVLGRGTLVDKRSFWNRVVDTPTTKIADAPGGTVIEVQGVVVPSEEGTVTSRWGRREAVWWQVEFSDTSDHIDTILHKEVVKRAFCVDDGSGQRALVRADLAHWNVTEQIWYPGQIFIPARPPMDRDLEREMKTFLLEKDGEQNRGGFDVTERVIGPGDPILVLGPTERGPDGQLVFHNRDGISETLHVSNMTQEQFIEDHKPYRRTARSMSMVGILVAVAGVGLFVIGLIMLAWRVVDPSAFR